MEGFSSPKNHFGIETHDTTFGIGTEVKILVSCQP